MQPRLLSFVESIANVAIGFGVAIAAVTVMLLLLGGGVGIGYGIGWKHAMMAVANSEIRGRR